MAKPDPHEVMTAALILRNKPVDINQLNSDSINNATKLVQELVDQWVKKIEGGSGDSGFFTKSGTTKVPNMVNLAKALSVSNYVVDQIKGKGDIKTVWQTGKHWLGEISKFNPDTGTIKNYNSSDVILKIETNGKNEADHFWGLSLKKRGIKEAEPTLLNKPVLGDVGFMTKRLESADVDAIEVAKEKFFRGALNIKSGGDPAYDKMPFPKVLSELDRLFYHKMVEKREMLTGQGDYKDNPNIYFEAIHKAFMKFDNDKKFFEDFFDLIFKVNLDTYINDASFHFSLITGIGDYNKTTKQIEVEDPSEKEGRLVSEIFRDMFKDPDNTNFRLQMATPRNKKKHAWEDGKKTAAKLFYEMIIGKNGDAVSVVDLEVRYKGKLQPQPQFQVFVNKIRTNSFHHKYMNIAKTKKLGDRRWE
tara:strand:- start:768 stop:2021 length:1254 start_codon:yes stop_codon:yes gene_type:complete